MKPRAPLATLLLPFAVGLCGLALTGWLWWHEQQHLDARMRADFDVSVRQMVGRIEQRLAAYEQMLRSARGLFDASDEVSPADFQRFVDALTGGAEFSGLQAVIFSRWRDERAAVTYIAPDSPLNRRALDRDLFASPERRTAMLQARDSGEIAITQQISLLMDTSRTAPSFAIYLALYERGARVDGLAERRAHLRGWVHVAFRLRDLMASLYGETTPGIAVSIYDDVRAEPASLIFESPPAAADGPPPRFATTEYISFPQHNWALNIRTTPAFEERNSRSPARVIAIAGGLGSLLLALLTWQLVTGRARADACARAMTRELRESEERMRHMAQHDSLTQPPNRALFSDRLQAALALARRERHGAAVMFVDLDHFKAVNDVHGHAVGDRLLVAAAARMQDCLRESDTLARLGGDEFVVLLPHIETAADAERVAERIRCALTHPFAIDSLRLTVAASIGIGLFPEHGNDDISLMKSADDTMYRAKERGGDRVVTAPGAR